MGNHLIIDNFLNDFESFRDHCDGVDYKGVENPVDGVFYPGVSADIPDHIAAEVVLKLNECFGVEIKPGEMFLRLSTASVDAPHQAHTDATMGQYGMMLYLNRLEDCIGGTSFVIHKETGLCENPVNKKQEDIWRQDTNNRDSWSILDMCSMIPNRVCIFDANKMHRAEPIGGFGVNAFDGRLVLVFFFSL